LNTYAIFKLEYDEIREFKTYIEFQLIRKAEPKEEADCLRRSMAESNQSKLELTSGEND
jgi:hypothetical protein